jgi:UDP:flavonoid glycosyltransferase YjiC (YdhE family)
VKVLVATSPGAGHVFPLVPLTWALRSAGHDVLVASAGRGVPLAVAAGLPCVDLAPGLDMDAVMVAAASRAGTTWNAGPTAAAATAVPTDAAPTDADPVDASTGFERALALFTEVSRVMLDGARHWVRVWEPDLVLHGALQGAGAVAAAEHGVPAVEHGVSPAAGWGDMVAAMWSALTDHAPVAPTAVVGLLPERFDVAPQRPDPPAVRLLKVRTVPYGGGAVVPPELLVPAERPRVLVTMGTVAPRFGGLDALRAIVTALADQDVEPVVALGDDPAVLGPVPDGVRVHRWIPLASVLPTCRAVVHHGGAGTALAALATGVGQVLVPQGADQFVNASALVAQGCGLRAALEPDPLRDAVARVVAGDLDDSVAAVGAEVAALPSPAAVAAALTG